MRVLSGWGVSIRCDFFFCSSLGDRTGCTFALASSTLAGLVPAHLVAMTCDSLSRVKVLGGGTDAASYPSGLFISSSLGGLFVKTLAGGV